MADLTHLPGLGGKDNQPGLGQTIFIAPVEWFATIKGFKTTTGVGDSVTIDGDHTFLLGFGFLKAYSTLDTAQYKLAPVGDRDGRGYKADLEFFNPGNSPESAEFMRIIKNHNNIILVRTPDGVVQQMGSEDLPAEIVGSYDSGKLSGGRRGTIYKAEAYQNGPVFYPGEITIKP